MNNGWFLIRSTDGRLAVVDFEPAASLYLAGPFVTREEGYKRLIEIDARNRRLCIMANVLAGAVVFVSIVVIARWLF